MHMKAPVVAKVHIFADALKNLFPVDHDHNEIRGLAVDFIIQYYVVLNIISSDVLLQGPFGDLPNLLSLRFFFQAPVQVYLKYLLK